MGKDRVMPCCSTRKASQWMHVDDRVKKILQNTGFDRLHAIHGGFLQDVNLIDSMIRRYNPDTEMFEFKNFELHLGLQDVAYLTGLPIDGEAVTGMDVTDESKELCANLIGKVELLKGEVNLESLKTEYHNVPDHVDNVDNYVRAYILYLLGTLLLPSSSKAVISPMYLPLLDPVDQVGKYAWGAAVLAHLKSAMRRYLHKDSRKVVGCTILIQFFALLYLPCLPRIYEESQGSLQKCPLMVEFTKILYKSSYAKNLTTVEEYDHLLDNMKAKHVDWQPYKKVMLPIHFKDRINAWMCKTVVLDFNDAAYHRPDLCPKQHGLKALREGLPEFTGDLKLGIKSGGTRGFDWKTRNEYKDYSNLWENRNKGLIGSPGCPLFENEDSGDSLDGSVPNHPTPPGPPLSHSPPAFTSHFEDLSPGDLYHDALTATAPDSSPPQSTIPAGDLDQGSTSHTLQQHGPKRKRLRTLFGWLLRV